MQYAKRHKILAQAQSDQVFIHNKYHQVMLQNQMEQMHKADINAFGKKESGR